MERRLGPDRYGREPFGRIEIKNNQSIIDQQGNVIGIGDSCQDSIGRILVLKEVNTGSFVFNDDKNNEVLVLHTELRALGLRKVNVSRA